MSEITKLYNTYNRISKWNCFHHILENNFQLHRQISESLYSISRLILKSNCREVAKPQIVGTASFPNDADHFTKVYSIKRWT